MFAFDRLLIDPPEAELVRALQQAARAANRRLGERRRLERTAATWGRSVRLHAHRAEGRQVWTAGRGGMPAAQVEMVWWTDHLGRRHVRVTGQRVSRASSRSARASPFHGWPLMLLYPERLLLCERGGRKELLAVCGCGAAGTPEALAWMGERCGPCQDRLQEGGPAPAEKPTVLEGLVRASAGIAFSPDGRELTAIGADREIHFWDCATGAGRPLAPPPFYAHSDAIAFAPDGESVAVGWSNGLVHRLGRPGRKWRRLAGSVRYVHSLAYSPDGKYLAVGGTGGNLLVDLSAPARAPSAWLPGRDVGRVVFAPDGRHLYALDYTGALFRVAVPAGAEVMFEAGLPRPEEDEEIVHPVRLALACSPDGCYVAAAADNARQRRFRLYEPDTGRARNLQPQPPAAAWALAFAPDGRTLAWGGWGPGNLRLWDVPSGAPRAVLTWGREALCTRSLAFSPEGATLAVADSERTIRLLPWRQVCNLPG